MAAKGQKADWPGGRQSPADDVTGKGLRPREAPSPVALEETARIIVAVCTDLPSIDAACIYPAVWDARIHLRFAGGALPASGVPGTACFPDEIALHRSILRRLASGRACDLPRGSVESAISTLKGIYLLPLGSRERIVGVLCTGTQGADGICPASRRRLDLLLPLFALSIQNARRCELPAFSTPPVSASDDSAELPPMDTVACFAHDIKNALTTISTFFQLLPAKWNDHRFRTTFYPVARDETLRAGSLVGVLLDHGRYQHTRRVSVDIGDLLEKVLEAKAPLAEHRRLRFQVHAGLASPTICADRAAIEEAIVNLLSNALEASPEGGCIAIRLENDLPPNGRPVIRLEIQDDGPGIDKGLEETIFAPYVSTKTGPPTTGGSGLGLSIARHHIEAHGGTIEFENRVDGGALFRVILPVERRRPAGKSNECDMAPKLQPDGTP